LRILTLATALPCLIAAFASPAFAEGAQVGPRPAYLVDQMADSPLKDTLKTCIGKPVRQTLFSIAHRGAPLQFPEHTAESYRAAALMGAGMIECDVTFTADKELVCRHAQDDLHTTTNVLTSPLAEKCSAAFTPAGDDTPASAECRSSDLTLAEFKTLSGKMDAANRQAKTPQDYQNGTANWRTDLYATSGTLLTHREAIELIKPTGAKFIPELKSPKVGMPYQGMRQEDYAQKLVDDYKAAGVAPQNVFLQSFNLKDVLYWIENEPEFGKQAIYLDGRFTVGGFNPADPNSLSPSMTDLKDMGVNIIAPPLWVLLALEEGEIVPSAYAVAAKSAGLDIMTWTLERSGPLASGGGWYFQTVQEAITGDGIVYEVLDVLAQDVGVKGVFSDWPATTSFYASCMGLE